MARTAAPAWMRALAVALAVLVIALVLGGVLSAVLADRSAPNVRE